MKQMYMKAAMKVQDKAIYRNRLLGRLLEEEILIMLP